MWAAWSVYFSRYGNPRSFTESEYLERGRCHVAVAKGERNRSCPGRTRGPGHAPGHTGTKMGSRRGHIGQSKINCYLRWDIEDRESRNYEQERVAGDAGSSPSTGYEVLGELAEFVSFTVSTAL